MSTAEWVGSIGVGLILVAFSNQLLGLTSRDGAAYLSMNAVGAGLESMDPATRSARSLRE